MQLHPGRASESARYAATCVARGFIGLDFRADVGDLRTGDNAIISGQKDYKLFFSEMRVGDLVLIQSHHYPFALVEVASDYLYLSNAPETLGVWFRHLRAISAPRFYADWVTNPKSWERIPMTDTIAPLRDPTGSTYRLIERWASSSGAGSELPTEA